VNETAVVQKSVRASRLAFFALGIPAVVGAGLLALWLLVGHARPSAAPVASINLIGYTNFTMSEPNTNVDVHPARGDWIEARMSLKNEGTASISYGVWGGEPFGWAKTQTDRGLTNGYLSPYFTRETAVLSPGSNAVFWVLLPTNTLRWECGFNVYTATARERAVWKMSHVQIPRLLDPLCRWFVVRLPDRWGVRAQIKSGSLEVHRSATNPVPIEPKSKP